MNAAKSSFGGGPAPDSIDRKISHAEPLLQIEEEQLTLLGVQKTTRKYTTDGTAMAFASQDTQVTSSAVWQEDTLIIVSKVMAIGGQFTDGMTLAQHGNALTSAVRIATSQGGADALLFRRAGLCGKRGPLTGRVGRRGIDFSSPPSESRPTSTTQTMRMGWQRRRSI